MIKKLPVLTLSIVFICMLSSVFPEIASVFIFDREAILCGEVWRLFSSHFVHLTINHLVYNLFAFTAAAWIIERENVYLLLFLFCLTALATGMTLLVFKPDMRYYGGLSGIACGLLYYAALMKIRKNSWKIISLCIITLLPLKIVIELIRSDSLLPYWGHQPFVTMPVSHFSGISTALFFYLVANYIPNYRKQTDLTSSAGDGGLSASSELKEQVHLLVTAIQQRISKRG